MSGDIEALQNLLIDGYDHIIDASDQIVQVAQTRGHANIAKFLEGVPEFEVIVIVGSWLSSVNGSNSECIILCFQSYHLVV